MLQEELFAVGSRVCSIWNGKFQINKSVIFHIYRNCCIWKEIRAPYLTLQISMWHHTVFRLEALSIIPKCQGAGSKPHRKMLSQTPVTCSPLGRLGPGSEPQAQLRPGRGPGPSWAALPAQHLHALCHGKQMGLQLWEVFLFYFESLSERHKLPLGLSEMLFPRKVISSHFPQSEHG